MALRIRSKNTPFLYSSFVMVAMTPITSVSLIFVMVTMTPITSVSLIFVMVAMTPITSVSLIFVDGCNDAHHYSFLFGNLNDVHSIVAKSRLFIAGHLC